MNEPPSHGFWIPLIAWLTVHVDLDKAAHWLLLALGIIGGIPAAAKGIRFIIRKLKGRQ